MHHLLRVIKRAPQTLLLLPFITAFILTVVLWLQNPGLYFSLLFSSSLSFNERLHFLGGIYTSLLTNFSVFGAVATVMLAALFALYLLLFILYVKRSKGANGVKSGAIGMMGFIAGLFGVGCAACGVVIFSSLLGLFGGVALLAVLPFEGAEFALLGSFIMVIGIFYLLRRLDDPLVCPIE